MGSEIQVVEQSFVAPSTPTPRNGLWVSSLDLAKARGGHTPLVYFFRRSNDDDDFLDLSRLKESMAKALVAFYPLAGRAGVDGDGRIQIDCNSEGALFVVARSKLSIDDLMPFPELRGSMMFVPRVEPSSVLLAVQVTFMKCGGVALGTAFHHLAVDASGDFHFMQTWSAFSRDGDGAAVELPCHDRTLLRARSPPIVHPDALSVLYSPEMIKNTSEPSGGAAAIAASIFVISNDQLASLKRVCGGASTFRALSALVWQCACAAWRLPPDAEARISFSVNARRRGSMIPVRYMGNGALMVYATGVARDIASGALEHVASRIRTTINRVDDELVRSAIDYHHELLESGFQPKRAFMGDAEMRVVSWLGMPMYDADFGWGKPMRVSRAGSVHRGYMHLVRDGPDADSAIRVMACLEAAHMKEFERLISAKLEGGLYHAKL
ncbi:hydroxycinnamoyltransferase 4-like [Miscanthus floridulus]|uniref:hydroxycinnamoyltransferase 4-like n=1 Tax=Miscanthus floridulus TaxID=154761 RepID=UPI0034576389